MSLAARGVREALRLDAQDGLDAVAERGPDPHHLGPDLRGHPARLRVRPYLGGAEPAQARERVQHAIERELRPALAPQVGRHHRGRDLAHDRGDPAGARRVGAVVLADLEGGVAAIGADGVGRLVHAGADEDDAAEGALAPRHRGHAMIVDAVLEIHHHAVGNPQVIHRHLGGPLRVVGLHGDEHRLERLAHLAPLAQAQGPHRHHVLAAAPGESQAAALDLLDVLGPGIGQGHVVAGFRQQATNHAADGSGSDDADPRLLNAHGFPPARDLDPHAAGPRVGYRTSARARKGVNVAAAG